MGKRIIITGGSGKVGQHVISHLLSRGHDILNLDITPLPAPLSEQVHTLRVDLTDSGHVHSALTSRFHPACPFYEPLNQIPDAVIHLASYPRNMIVPDGETYRVNTQAGYNVIEAATRLGIRKIIIASTVCVYGPPYAEGDADFPSFPVDEKVDTNPMDTYAISKVCVERTARGFARRFVSKKVDVYVFRLAAVIGPDEYETVFGKWKARPAEMRAVGWSYTDARDFGRMCDLAVLKDGLGFQIFNATNDEITVDTDLTTAKYLAEEAGDVPFTRKMGQSEAPLTNRKIKEMLGFREEHSWRKYFSYH
ncbi:hypothetical protein BDW59DRAFT_140247 [Aspergillus cavernicola]|uniref:NAD-dependent epimerase/dehydratase domain-containing protein n=1 Tax=Aspergillus cavernicola TaxID=176166 RepID=A0ABR4IXG2_9EURO